jgi:diacylglycerol kinase family enzyme
MNVVLVYNPLAGNHNPARLAALTRALEAREHRVTQLDSRLAPDSPGAREADLLCVAGGDGTVRDVIAGWNDAPLPRIGVYPAGTINLVAREAGYPADPSAFVERLDGPGRRHFIARADARPFLVCASAGPDSAAVAAVSPALKRRIGRMAYAVAFAGVLARWPRQRLTVRVADSEYQAEAAFVLKGRYFAGPWTLAPAAALTGAQLEILLLPRARRRDVVRLVLWATLSRRFADPRWLRFAAAEVEIDAAMPVPVQADGDIVGALPMRFGIASDPLEFA